MEKYAHIYPMFIMVLLTAFVMIFTLITRIRAVRKGEMNRNYFKTFNEGNPSEAVIKTGRHFSNLFELPLLFYVGCITSMLLPQPITPLWAWLFVASRIVHTYIHLGCNNIYPRMISYFLGWVCVLVMWSTIVLAISA